MKTNKFIRLNITFKPPEEMTKKVISLNHKIAQGYKSFFILDGVNFFPHITIYSPEYPESNLNKVLKEVEDISHNNSGVVFKLQKISEHQSFIGIYFQLTPEIKNLHQEIVKKLNPLREGHIREKYQRDDYQVEYTPEQLENIKKYGYPDSMNLYHPHLTIIRLKDKNEAKDIAGGIDWKEEFTSKKIAVYTMGKHGTCIKLVEEFSLK